MNGNYNRLDWMKVLKTKPTDWNLGTWILIAAVFGLPNLLNFLGFNVPTLSRFKNNTDAPKEVIIKLTEAQAKQNEAISLLADDYREYKARSEQRMNSFEKLIEVNNKDIRELRIMQKARN